MIRGRLIRGRRPWRTVAPAVLLCPVILLSAGGCGRDVPASALIGVSSTAPADRTPMPALGGTGLDGSAIELSDYLGRVVVLNGWASWCAPCQAEMPALDTLSRAADPSEVAFLGVNVSDTHDSAVALMAETGVDYPSIVDPRGALWASIPGIPPKALPSTVIVDRQGKIAATVVGEVDATELEGLIRRISDESA